jgi:hypothetical protein
MEARKKQSQGLGRRNPLITKVMARYLRIRLTIPIFHASPCVATTSTILFD